MQSLLNESPEIIARIFSFLDARSLLAFASCSRDFHNIVHDPAVVAASVTSLFGSSSTLHKLVTSMAEPAQQPAHIPDLVPRFADINQEAKVLIVDMASATIQSSAVQCQRILVGGPAVLIAVFENLRKCNGDQEDIGPVVGIALGALSGSGFPGSSNATIASFHDRNQRLEIGTISGPFVGALRGIGFEAIFFKGVSRKLVFVQIDQHICQLRCRLRDAEMMLGKSASATCRGLAALGIGAEVVCCGSSGLLCGNATRDCCLIAGHAAVFKKMNLVGVCIRPLSHSEFPVTDVDCSKQLRTKFSANAMRTVPRAEARKILGGFLSRPTAFIWANLWAEIKHQPLLDRDSFRALTAELTVFETAAVSVLFGVHSHEKQSLAFIQGLLKRLSLLVWLQPALQSISGCITADCLLHISFTQYLQDPLQCLGVCIEHHRYGNPCQTVAEASAFEAKKDRASCLRVSYECLGLTPDEGTHLFDGALDFVNAATGWQVSEGTLLAAALSCMLRREEFEHPQT